MSSDGKIECRIRLKNLDFIMQNHRVHGVSILPGVTFLDIVYRVLAAQKLDYRRAMLRNILFPEAVVTRDGFDRDFSITMTPVAAGGWQLKSESRWVEGELPRSSWKENFRCELSFEDEPEPGPIKIAALKAGARKQRDMEKLYSWARAEGIKHGPAMKCQGTLYIGDPYLLGELQLNPSGTAAHNSFYLHPAELDASTIAAFSRTEPREHVPFIPVFIDRFRAHRPLPSKFYLYSPSVEVQVPSGDAIHSDYFLYDGEGRFVAEFAHLMCKRIRLPELITRLVEEVGGPAVTPGTTDSKLRDSAAAPPPSASLFSDYLRRMIAGRLNKQLAEIKTNVGFYDLGLDSLALLRISQELEKVVDRHLYPTLLFEYGNIDALAAHLGSKYQFRETPVQVEITTVAPPACAQASLEATCYRTVWIQPAGSRGTPEQEAELGNVLIFGAKGDLLQALCGRLAAPGRRVIRVHAAAKFTAIASDVYELDLTSREQVRALLDALAATGTVARQYLCIAPGAADGAPQLSDAVNPCLSMWALAAELAVRKHERDCNLRFIYRRHGKQSPPQYAAVGALARALSDEAQVLHARVIELEEEASANSSAEIICQELRDRSNEFEVRYRSGQRQVRRFAPYVPGNPGKDVLLKNRGVYVLAGAGGISRILGDRLAKDWKARIVLVGRRPFPNAVAADFERWRAYGAEAKYIQADITDQAEVTAALAAAREAFGRLDGIFHCAGVLADALFFRKDANDILRVLAPKVMGAMHLDAASKNDRLDCFVMFSSLAASITNPGQCDYAFANAFLECFAEWRSARSDRSGKTLAIGWPLWAEGGMQIETAVQERARQQTGIWPLPTPVALEILLGAMSGSEARFAVTYGAPEETQRMFPQEPAKPESMAVSAAEEAPVQLPAKAASMIERHGSSSADIAIIGLAGQYPQARNLDEFWQNLLSGRDCIVEIPADRWDHSLFFDAEKGRTGKTYSKWGGFLDGVDLFDFGLFGISRKDAERMDPQERLFLKTSWMTLQDAGYTPQALSEEIVGVFAGVMWNHYQLFEDRESGTAPPAMHASVANRVSYCLNFRGPSLAVDTACSSSLTALHLAVESIRRGECTLALAGGVNVTIHPQKYLQLAQGQFLSSDGRCRSFGKEGSGYVPGEGVGAVLLKPLAGALADRDQIYAVIKGSHLNHTGRTSGFTVPSPDSQGNLIREAMTRAAVAPDTIGYVEAHGTGTSLGDPIEINGLERAFAESSLPPQACAIGSVKSNIGHLESAAGIAGLTKVLLQMKHRVLVPSLHVEELNPHIDFKTSPFFVVREPLTWYPPANQTRLRAGISAFGAGGANVHVLLEDYAPTVSPLNFEGPCLVVLSARDRSALEGYAKSLVSFLAGGVPAAGLAARGESQDFLRQAVAEVLGVPSEAVNPHESFRDLGFDTVRLADLAGRIASRDSSGPLSAAPALDATIESAAGSADAMPGNELPRLDDLAYTLQVGRTPMPARLAVVARDLTSLRSGLNRFLSGSQPGPDEFWDFQPAAKESEPGAQKFVELFHAGLLHELARHWVAGANVPWRLCYPRPDWDQAPHRVSLPGPPFREERCWLGRWKSQVQPGSATTERNQGQRRSDEAPAQMRSGSEPAMRVLEGGVALIVMKDPEIANMFTERVLYDVETAFTEIASRPEIKAVVITGSGNVFSMGASRETLEKLAARESHFTDSPFLYEGLLRCDRPVVAAIQGHASGGGLIFGLYADIVLMAREGVYSANFVKYGFTPGLGATYILEKRFGQSLAAEMFYTGRSFSGEELEKRSAQVTFLPQDKVLETALELARSIAEKPPHASQTLKRELAGRTLEKLPEIVAREDGMHDRVLDESTVQHIQDHFRKIDSFHQPTSAPLSPEDAQPAPERKQARPPAEERSESSAGYDNVVTVIERALCAHLYVQRIEIDSQLTFHDMGVDSIGAVEIVRDLNRSFSLNLDSATVYDYPTVPKLAEFVLSRCSRAHAPAAQLAAAATSAKTAQPLTPSVSTSGGPAPAFEIKLDPPSPPAASFSTSRNSTPSTGNAEHMIVLAPTKPAEIRSSSDSVERARAKSSGRIAVIGMSGRFPEAPDLDAFWANLYAGRCSVHEVPAERWDHSQVRDGGRNGGTECCKWAALLDDVDQFDAAFFNLSPMEAELMDPQQRIFLQYAWAALEDAGYAGVAGGTQKCGVFVGSGAGDYLRLLEQAGAAGAGHVFLGNSPSILAARIAYFLNLSGPTIALDTACSSSLVAVHLACESIRNGECDMALAGGVALMFTPTMHVWTNDLAILSPSGKCAPFDKSADGIVLGEGVGVVALKALEQALEDGDHIYGVIAASGMNGDGKTNGITAPSALSQIALLDSVYGKAGISPEDVTYIEAHGTGTALGDPIEIKALNDVFRRRTSQVGGCGIGSVKSNIGHTTLAAGIAGLIKVLLALEHSYLPPSVNFQSANPKIDFKDSPFFVVTQGTAWRAGRSGQRIGAVSSFGFSGTNCHLVVAEAPQLLAQSHERRDDNGYFLMPVSAKTEEALRNRLQQLTDYLKHRPNIADLAFTLGVGRQHFRFRAAFVTRNLQELAQSLQLVLAGEKAPRAFQNAPGTQTSVPPGSSTSDPIPPNENGISSPDYLEEFAKAYVQGSDPDWTLLYKGRSVKRIPLPTYPFARERHWVKGVSLPAASGVRHHPWLGRQLSETGSGDRAVFSGEIHPDNLIVADHRVANRPILPAAACLEMALAAAAGHISTPIRLTSVRWLQQLEVAATRSIRFSLLPEGPRHIFELGVPDEQVPYARGTVSPAVERLSPEIVDLRAIADKCPNAVSCQEIYGAFDRAGIQYGAAFRVLESVSFGKEQAIGKLVAPQVSAGDVSQFKLHPYLLDGALQAAAVLEAQVGSQPHIPVSMDSLELLRPLAAPGFSCVTRKGDHKFDVVITDAEGRVCVRCEGFALRPRKTDREASIWIPGWMEAGTRPQPAPRNARSRRVGVFCTPGSSRSLIPELVKLHPNDEIVEGQSGHELLRSPLDIMYFLACGNGSSPAEQAESTLALFRVVKRLISIDQIHHPLRLKVILTGAVSTSEEEVLRPDLAGLLGLSRAISAEYPRWTVGCIDIGIDPQDMRRAARSIFEEALDHRLVALRGDRRLVRVFKPCPPMSSSNSLFKERGTYLILGGAGGIGFALSRHLARARHARLAWIGRRPLDSELERKLAEIKSLGGEAIYLQADAADLTALQRAVADARKEFGALHGAFHAAGTLHGKTLANLDEAEFLQVLAPKVSGAVNLVEALKKEPFELLVFFSSAASFVDPGGQASYAAASTFEDAFAHDVRQRYRLPVSVINWGYWGNVGMVADESYAARFAALGVGSIGSADGMAALEKILAAKLPQALVLKADPARLPDFGINVLHDDEASPSSSSVGQAALDQPAISYVKRIFAEVLKCQPSRLGEQETFENFGVDSLIGMRILHRLEEDLGDLPSTLLFECITIEQLAGHLVKQRRPRLAALLKPEVEHAEVPELAGEHPGEVKPPAARVFDGKTSYSADDIAVISVSGRYPQSPDLPAFWKNLASGTNCVKEIPESRWDWRAHFDPRRGQPNRSYGKWGGFLEEIDRFDAAFFNILPRDAALLDPQERLFLETCWNLLEEAGYLGEHTREPETGVFVGVMYGSYGKLAAATDWPRGRLASAHSDYWSLANRVSYFFDLHGPSFAVDSACSSSLTAVHLACESIRRGECQMAIAGGVNLIIHQAHFVALSAMNMLSTHPGCRVFDEAADGYVPGEGVGAVLLKPLQRAIEEGDQIWGILKASFLNAGGKTSGYTVPNPAAQSRLITETLRRSGVHPDTITYIEAHGTGTELGDPIEVASLTKAFPQTQAGPQRAIGSVKANIGHLEGAAGIAGLTKVLLQLKHKKLVPCANLTSLNPKIDFASSPFRAQTALADWERPVLNLDGQERTYPRRAGVSSFGAGGANAHVILEEYSAEIASEENPSEEHVFLLSAKTTDQLRALVKAVAEFLSGSERQPCSLRELAYSSQLGRREMAERIAVCAHTTAELNSLLQCFLGHGHDDRFFTGVADGKMPVDLSLHPGGIGGSAENTPLPELARAWVRGVRVDWRQLWPGAKPRRVAFPTYPFERKRFWLSADNATTEPIRDWKSRSVEHALPGDAFYCTDHRISGERWLPGVAFLDMVYHECATGLAEERFQIRDLKWVSPLKLVDRENRIEIALESQAGDIDFRIAAAGEPARVFVRGTVSRTNSVEGIALDLAGARQRCQQKGEVSLFYAELARGGLDYGPAFRTVDALWIGNNECLAHLALPQPLERDFHHFGLHPALMDGALQSTSSLCKTSTPYLPSGFLQMTIHAPLTPQCWVHVQEVASGEERDSSRRFNLSIANEKGQILVHLEELRIVPQLGKTNPCRYLRPVWEKALSPGESRPLSNILLITDDAEVRASLQSRLASYGARSISVAPGSTFAQSGELSYELAPGDREHYQRLVEQLAARNMLPDGIIHFWSRGSLEANPDGLSAQLDRGFYSVLWLATAVLAQGKETKLRLVFAHSEHNSGPQPQFAAVAGALKTLALEHTRFAATRVVFEGEEGALSSETLAARLIDEALCCSDQVAEIAYRSTGRWAKRLETFDPAAPVAPPHLSLRSNGAYLITGGAGILGFRFAELLAQQGAAHIVLVGRSALDQVRQARLDSLDPSHKRLHYYRADLNQVSELQQLVATVEKQYGPIHGVIHAAGVIHDARAIKKTRTEIETVIAAKVMGTVYLDEATRFEPLDFFVLFSSVVGETGNLGQVDYAFANAFMNEFVAIRELRRNAGLRSGKTLSICWPLWQESGMNVDPATLRLLSQKWRMVPLSTEAGLRAFCHGLSRPESSFAVVQNPETTPLPRKMYNAAVEASLSRKVEELPKIEADLRLLASRFLLVDPKDIDLQANLMELGFDSISLTELTNQVNEKYDLSLLPTVLFERPNLAGLAAHLQEASSTANVAYQIAEEPEPGEIFEDPRSESVLSVGESNGHKKQREVAIIGMAGMLPKSEDLEEFWRHLVAGEDLVTTVPEDRTELRRDPLTGKIRGGFLQHVSHFDAQFFGISPREASLMDPQQRLFLETVWQVIQDAGYRACDLAGSATGLFAGVSTSDYGDLLKESGIEVEAHTASGIAHAILANRISYLFDLRGPSEAIDTACSSSLVAIHRATRAVADGECEMAIAGGVNINLSPGLFTAFIKSGMLSPEGKCKTFDQDADGYVRGEGSGAVFVKSMDRALADGDHIYAVIKGSAINHGGRSPSLTAPNPEAQAAVIVQAYRAAGVHPGSVTYIEAHGTGTKLGDPIEIEGLKKAFTTLYGDWNQPLPCDSRIAIGSTKTNIGHLEAAAGIAGVLKVLLCMQHRALPGNLHFETLNPHIRLEQTPFYINQQMQHWEPVLDGGAKPVRRAGISSFGFGGSNAHLVLEAFNAPEPTNRAKRPDDYLIVLSAPSSEALAVYAGRIARVLQQRPAIDLADLAYTLQVGRMEMVERLAIVARDRTHLIEALLAAARGNHSIAGLFRGAAQPSQQSAATYEKLGLLAQSWVQGAVIDWQRLQLELKPGRISLPAFPLARTRHWFNESASNKKANVTQPEQSLRTTENSNVAQPEQSPRTSEKVNVPQQEQSPLTTNLEPKSRGRYAPKIILSRPKEAAEETPSHKLLPSPQNGQPRLDVAPDGPPPVTAPVAEIVKQVLVTLLDIPAAEIREDRRFADLGLDSIYRIELVRRLNRILAVDLKARELYNYETFGQLVQALQATVPEPSKPALQALPADLGRSSSPKRAEEALERVIGDVVRRSFDPSKTFAENGFTSFDMLRVIALVEKQLGALRKTLLFDCPTLAALSAHLCEVHGHSAVEHLTSVQPEQLNRSNFTIAPVRDDQPIVLAKSRLHEQSTYELLVAELEQHYGKESGLPSRDIAPFVFIGVERKGYFHISVREDTMFAWSYVGSPDYFSQLTHELVVYADAHGLKPSLLSLVRLTEVGGKAFTATPFGAVQRLWNLGDFTLKGQKMQRLRYMVGKFERSGRCRAVEYKSGSDPAMDRQLATLIDQWCQVKPMVNPYVSTVKREILTGMLKPKHRIFLSYLDDALVAAVVITRILSENGYGLDLEFYSKHTPLGAIDWTIVQIIEKIVSEGFSLFSFGGTWGVKISDSPNADPHVEEALEQMRSTGIFNGDGNLQFKNKFRPENAPVYLCRPAGADPSDLSKIILMIADPLIAAAQPDAVALPNDGRPPIIAEAGASAQRGPERERALAASGYNPVKVPHHHADFDLLTDSWMELDGPFIHERMAVLATSSGANGLGNELSKPSWLPFSYIIPTMSGRSAEAALCGSWPKRNQLVVQNSLFPTWALSQLESGFTPIVVKPDEPSPRAGRLFQGDICIADLKRVLSEDAGRVAFIALELSTNATGGYPISLANLKQVKEAAQACGVPLVLDATRIVENAFFIADHEQEYSGRNVWDITREILALADTATFSLSKDFGINFGGLVATNDQRLIDRLRERANTRGAELGLSHRRLISAALADQVQVATLVKARMLAVKTLWDHLTAAGIPVVGPASGHCVLIDVNRIPQLTGFRYPVQACLLWIYRNTGIRAASHLAGSDAGAAFKSCIRLAVPVGLSYGSVEQIARQLVEMFRSPGRIADLMRIDDPASHANPALGDYHPVDNVPEDVRAALEERLQPRNDNVAVMEEYNSTIERRVIKLPQGDVEVFIGGAGPTLLLVHPFNIGAGFFAPQFKALSGYFRMVTIHAPGVGSTRVSSDFSFPGLARLCMRTLQELGVGMPVHVLGASFGGVTAQAFALEYPSDTASVTLLGSSYKVGNRRGEVNRLAVVARADIDGVLKNAPSERLQQQRNQIEELLLRCESMDPRTGLNYLEEFAKQPDFLAKLPFIAAPTLIVHGRFDSVITQKTAHLLHGSIPNARYEEIADAGHFPSLTSSDQVNRVLLEFLAAVNPAPISAGDTPQVLAAASTGGIRL